MEFCLFRHLRHRRRHLGSLDLHHRLQIWELWQVVRTKSVERVRIGRSWLESDARLSGTVPQKRGGPTDSDGTLGS